MNKKKAGLIFVAFLLCLAGEFVIRTKLGNFALSFSQGLLWRKSSANERGRVSFLSFFLGLVSMIIFLTSTSSVECHGCAENEDDERKEYCLAPLSLHLSNRFTVLCFSSKCLPFRAAVGRRKKAIEKKRTRRTFLVAHDPESIANGTHAAMHASNLRAFQIFFFRVKSKICFVFILLTVPCQLIEAS